MSTNRFAFITIVSALFCILAVISIDISQSEIDEVVAIRRSIPQLSRSSSPLKAVPPSKPLPGVTSTFP